MERKQKAKIVKRIALLIGLAGFTITWASLAAYGAVWLARKIGWLL